MRLATAIELWRGDPLSDIAPEELRSRAVPRLAEERLDAFEDLCEARLQLGMFSETAVELPAVIAEHPLRERLHHPLMRARYGVGRQSEAVATYLSHRQHLVADLGLEPGPDRQALHSRILNQDTSLGASVVRVVGGHPRQSGGERRVALQLARRMPDNLKSGLSAADPPCDFQRRPGRRFVPFSQTPLRRFGAARVWSRRRGLWLAG